MTTQRADGGDGAEATAKHDAELAEIDRDIEGYLARHEQKELCRFVAVGSVDDGKSTLIGRLLHDTKGLYEDQLAAVKRATKQRSDGGEADEIDFSLFTDGLKAEREQGITIDVAYRYFSTEKRKFIIADTPGHVQYTRNMATGASTADVAVILLDARLGVLSQSRRHAFIASLLGISHLLVAVNKMDLVDYAEEPFNRLSREFHAFASQLGFSSVTFIPISARRGDNVVAPSPRMPWFEGGTLLHHLETLPLDRDRRHEPLRFPVQYVLRPHLDYRGFAGQIASGSVRPGDEIVVLPSGRRTRVRSVDSDSRELPEAAAPMSVTLRLTDEVDVSRGDMLVRPDELPRVERRFDAMLVWMAERALDPQRSLLLKQTTRIVPARIERVHHRVDLETLAPSPATGLQMNDIGRVTVRCNRPILCDAYARNHVTGAFILIDALSNDTVAAGMILEAAGGDAAAARGTVAPAERHARLGQRGAALWIGGDPARALAVERALFDRGRFGLVAPAGELSDDALGELVVRSVDAGLAVIVLGAAAGVREVIAARLGSARSASESDAGEEATAEALAELLSDLAAPGDPG